MIAIGCDHGGYELKLEIIKYLEKNGLEYKDFGCNGESVDYPIYLGENVSSCKEIYEFNSSFVDCLKPITIDLYTSPEAINSFKDFGVPFFLPNEILLIPLSSSTEPYKYHSPFTHIPLS